MGADSAIAWTDHTFNPWWGCTKIATGCTHCYASAFSKRTGHDVWGDDRPRRFFGDAHWAEPLKWARKGIHCERCDGDGKVSVADDLVQPCDVCDGSGRRRPRVFCGSMCDVFEARADLVEHQGRLWDLMHATPSLDWLLLTKRPLNATGVGIPDNVMLGTSVCEQSDTINVGHSALVGGPWFLSCEPLVGQIVLPVEHLRRIGWLIIGGESGPGHRAMSLGYMHFLVEQADAFNIPVFVKQDSGPYPGKQGRIPDDLWARKEFPK